MQSTKSSHAWLALLAAPLVAVAAIVLAAPRPGADVRHPLRRPSGRPIPAVMPSRAPGAEHGGPVTESLAKPASGVQLGILSAPQVAEGSVLRREKRDQGLERRARALARGVGWEASTTDLEQFESWLADQPNLRGWRREAPERRRVRGQRFNESSSDQRARLLSMFGEETSQRIARSGVLLEADLESGDLIPVDVHGVPIRLAGGLRDD